MSGPDDNSAPSNRENGLSWLDNDTPVSQRFGDHYYETNDGREETRAIFLAGNGLPERWREPTKFTISELGFGTGLNFFETLHQWFARAAPNDHLTFVSFERYPISITEMQRAISRWDDLRPWLDQLGEHWPPASSQLNLDFRPGDMRTDAPTAELQLFVGDARDTIADWNGKADAWFLDGFSPAKNPEMWEEELLAQVHAHTREDGTFSTYTAAGWVRRNLESAGFTVEKVAGFGRKRERLQGRT